MIAEPGTTASLLLGFAAIVLLAVILYLLFGVVERAWRRANHPPEDMNVYFCECGKSGVRTNQIENPVPCFVCEHCGKNIGGFFVPHDLSECIGCKAIRCERCNQGDDCH